MAEIFPEAPEPQQPEEPGAGQPEVPPEAEGEGAPVPGAAPAPAPADPGRVAELEAELSRLRGGAVTGAKVFLQIAADDAVSSFTAAGVTVGRGPSPVPQHLATTVLDAAVEAGVHLTETET